MAINNNLLKFKEWVAKNPSIPFNRRLDLYDLYLKNALVNQVVIDNQESINLTKNAYKSFLNRITVIYNDDPDIIELKGLDLDDPHQLASAIPIFAEKIRDIALFYNKKRRDLKTKKIELSMKGSVDALRISIEDLFFNKYSMNNMYQDPTINDLDILRGVSDRQTVIDSLDIEIEELVNITAQHPHSNN